MTQKEEFKRALEILEEIEENVGVCCAVTMEPDEVLVLIDKLKEILEKFKNEYSKESNTK
jgi:3-deoxy-D-arabino-heptulosonate 7-phosphate (DAHP) synthase class II